MKTKTKINTLSGAVLSLIISTLTTNAATQVYDLKADWSDTQNPNGAWSYRDWNRNSLLISDPFPWTSTILSGGGRISRTAESDVIPGKLELGDIFVEMPIDYVGPCWTAPAAGTINVSATAWMDTGLEEWWDTGADWWLLHSGSANVLSSGYVVSGTRDLPYDLSSGSGGASALQNIAVQAGDQIQLLFGAGNGRNGLNFTITLTTDSVDPVSAIEALALTVVDMNLHNGIENSLDGKLDAALAALEDTNMNNDGAACNSLLAFVNAVEAQRGNKITSVQADQLAAAAHEISSILGCAN